MDVGDKQNSSSFHFVTERLKLLRLKHFYSAYPNLASSVDLNIRIPDPRYIKPISHMKNKLVKVNTAFNKKGCDMVSCNPNYPPLKSCDAKTEPIAFSVDAVSETINACQPACNVFKPRISDDSKYGIQYFSPYTVWNKRNNKCYIENPNILAFMIDSKRRNEFENKDYSSNFHTSVETDSVGSNYISGRIHPNYCKLYGMDMTDQEINSLYNGVDPKNAKTCDLTSGKYVSSLLLGSSLTRLFSSKVDYLMHNAEYDKMYNIIFKKVENNNIVNKKVWLNARGIYDYSDLSEDITLNDLQITSPEQVWHKLPVGGSKYGELKIDKSFNTNILLLYNEEITAETIQIERDAYNDDSLDNYINKIATSLYTLYGNILSTENLTAITVGEAGEITSKKLGNVISKESKNLINHMLKNKHLFERLILRYGSRILDKAVFNKFVLTVVMDRLLFTIGRTVALISKMSVAAINIIGLLFIIGPILDIVFTFWDPLKLAVTPFSDVMLYKISESAIREKLSQVGKANLELDPILFWLYYVRPSLKMEDQEKFINEELLLTYSLCIEYFTQNTNDDMDKSVLQDKITSYLEDQIEKLNIQILNVDDVNTFTSCKKQISLLCILFLLIIIICHVFLNLVYTTILTISFSLFIIYSSLNCYLQ